MVPVYKILSHCYWVFSGLWGAKMWRRSVSLGHELCGSLLVLCPHPQKPLATPGSRLHAFGFQVARDHAFKCTETLHLHRQFHYTLWSFGKLPSLLDIIFHISTTQLVLLPNRGWALWLLLEYRMVFLFLLHPNLFLFLLYMNIFFRLLNLAYWVQLPINYLKLEVNSKLPLFAEHIKF